MVLRYPAGRMLSSGCGCKKLTTRDIRILSLGNGKRFLQFRGRKSWNEEEELDLATRRIGDSGSRPGVAFPVGQTLGQTASFRQTAPETWCQSRVCGASRSPQQVTLRHLAERRQLAGLPFGISTQLVRHQVRY